MTSIGRCWMAASSPLDWGTEYRALVKETLKEFRTLIDQNKADIIVLQRDFAVEREKNSQRSLIVGLLGGLIPATVAFIYFIVKH